MRRVRRLTVSVLALAALAALLTGCTGMGTYHALPVWSPGPVIPASVVEGVLRWDGACVRIEADDGTRWVVVWPAGTRLREDNVPPLLVDQGDRGIAYLGDLITLPGIGIRAGDVAGLRANGLDGAPEDCPDEPLWLAVPFRR